MTSIIDRMIKRGKQIGEMQTRKRSQVLEYARDRHELNQLVVRHSLPHSELANLIGVTRPRLHQLVQEAVEKGAMESVMRDVNKYHYTLTHIHQLMEYMKMSSWRDEYNGTIVMPVSNLKGGTGKSSSAIHIAAALALDLLLRPRVLVIDFDPQGSLSAYGTTAEDDETNTVTAADIALADYEPEDESIFHHLKKQGLSEEEIFGHALIESHIPNLHIMPALTHDHRFEHTYYSHNDEGREKVLASLKEKVIDKVKDFYDIILIDTGPHNAPSSWAALEAANAVLVPVSPRTLDWDATGLFLRTLPEYVRELCPSKGENIRWFKTVAVNADKTHNRDKAMLMTIKQQMGADALTSSILRTQAFEEAAARYVTVFDLLKKDAVSSAKSIDQAVDSVNAVADEIKLDLLVEFGA